VLAHPGTRAGRHEAGHRGHVQRGHPPSGGTARPDDVDAAVGELERLGGVEHGAHHPRQLVDGLTLHAQGDDDRRDLGRGRPPLEDLAEDGAGFVAGQVAVGEEGPEEPRPPAVLVEAAHGEVRP